MLSVCTALLPARMYLFKLKDDNFSLPVSSNTCIQKHGQVTQIARHRNMQLRPNRSESS